MLLTPRSAPVARARRLTRPSGRREAGAFLVDGPQAVREALDAGVVTALFATDDAAARYPGLLALAPTVHRVDDRALALLSGSVTPQGLVAVAPLVAVDLHALDAALDTPRARAGPRLVVVLDGVADPGNAGAVIRVADAAGAAAVVLTEGSVDPHNDKCVRASAGSLWHLPVVLGGPTAGALDRLRELGLRLLAADGGGGDLDAVGDEGIGADVAWILGNEAHGLSDAARLRADAVLRVPLRGRAESMNLATAAAVCVYASVFAGGRLGRHHPE